MTVKQQVANLVEQLPEDCTYEDVQYKLYVLEKIAKATAELDRGEGISEEEARQRLSKWLDD